MYSNTDTVKEILKVAGKSNWVSLLFFVFLLIYIVIREYDLSDTVQNGSALFYQRWSPAFWFAAASFMVYASAMPIYRIRNQPGGHTILVSSFLCAGLVVIFLIIISFHRVGEMEEGGGLVAAIIGAIISILVLFLKSQMDSLIRRTSNSLNTLLEIKMSEVYQEHFNNVNRVYPSVRNSVIPQSDFDAFKKMNPASLFAEKESNKAEIDQWKAINSQIQILNFFEFLALGIEKFVLDEELLFESLGGILIMNYKRASHVIDDVRSSDKKSLVMVSELQSRWEERREADNTALKEK